MLWGHFKQQNHQGKAPKCKKHGTQKGHCLQHESSNKRQGVTLFNTSAGNKGLGRPKFLAALRMSTNDYKSAMNIDFVVTNKF